MNTIRRRAFLRWVGTSVGGLCVGCDFGKAERQDPSRRPVGPEAHVLEDAFGRAEIDLQHPALTRLFLRQGDGRLGVKSLLSEHASEFPEWAIGGSSYLVGEDGRRYESRYSTGHSWESDGRNKTLRISNISLGNNDGKRSPCTEEWVLSVTGQGSLRWEIRRKFERPFKAAYHGGPALFFNISPNTRWIPGIAQRRNPTGNGVAINWWMAADALNGDTLADYKEFPIRMGYLLECLPPSNSLTMRSKEGWAIFKLYTSFAHDQDLRIQAEGGHLYRRGMFYGFGEVGITAGSSAAQQYESGQVVNLAIELTPVPQFESGQQLMVELADAKMERALKSYFSGLANAGCLIDCEQHLFGNQCDGLFYAGNMHWHGYSLLASCATSSAMSSAPITYPEVFSKTLSSNLEAVDERGEVMHGYRHEGPWPGLPMMNLIGLEAYLLYSGDVDYASRYLSTVKHLDRYLQRWLKDGVFHVARDQIVVPNQYINWYYDIVIGAHGYTMYHNVNCVRSLMALETIYTALGESALASACSERRRLMIPRINEVFWDDNAYGQGRGGYIDWIREDGQKRRCFFACNQYPAILFDIASCEQARRLLATADERIEELERYFDYHGDGTLDNLWPLSDGDIHHDLYRFGGLCNGGMLIAMTFWEVAARCHAGAPDGAYRLLKKFSEHAARTNWFEGANGFLMTGKPAAPFYEPFLADGLVAAAGVVHGFLGLRYSWEGVSATPHLPAGWDKMAARIMFRGIPYLISAQSDGNVSIVQDG